MAKKRKMTVEFSEAATTELTNISKALGVTKANVLRNALAIYGFIADELHKKKGIGLAVVENEAEIKKMIKVPGIDT